MIFDSHNEIKVHGWINTFLEEMTKKAQQL